MGAGRKTQTFTVSEKAQQRVTVNCRTTARNIKKCDLAGVIFGCRHSTYRECLSKQLFGCFSIPLIFCFIIGSNDLLLVDSICTQSCSLSYEKNGVCIPTGLPAPHYSYVKNIQPGLPLFLFNYSDRKLHGIFEAASSGKLDINPRAWTTDDSEITPYAAQVLLVIIVLL